jgi:TonB family protein
VLLLVVGCATAPLPVAPGTQGDAPEISDFRARWPEFYQTAKAALERQFHGAEVAERAQLGSGRWRLVVRIDLDPVGENQGCKLLRSSGFNALDEEAMAACKRIKDGLFPPEELVDVDRRAHCPIQLTVER